MDPEMTALIVAGATCLVTAAASGAGDGLWNVVRPRFAVLFGRGDAAREAVAARRLDDTAAELGSLGDDDRAPVLDRHRTAWAARLADLIDEHPAAEADLTALLAEVGERPPAPRTSHVQHNTAHSGTRTPTRGTAPPPRC
jgi:hypothetical protein